jgi:hypothetical protein
MKVRVNYHGIEVEVILPETAGEKVMDRDGWSKDKHPYPFKYDSDTAAKVAKDMISECIKAVKSLKGS